MQILKPETCVSGQMKNPPTAEFSLATVGSVSVTLPKAEQGRDREARILYCDVFRGTRRVAGHYRSLPSALRRVCHQ